IVSSDLAQSRVRVMQRIPPPKTRSFAAATPGSSPSAGVAPRTSSADDPHNEPPDRRGNTPPDANTPTHCADVPRCTNAPPEPTRPGPATHSPTPRPPGPRGEFDRLAPSSHSPPGSAA